MTYPAIFFVILPVFAKQVLDCSCRRHKISSPVSIALMDYTRTERINSSMILLFGFSKCLYLVGNRESVQHLLIIRRRCLPIPGTQPIPVVSVFRIRALFLPGVTFNAVGSVHYQLHNHSSPASNLPRAVLYRSEVWFPVFQFISRAFQRYW